MYPPQGDQPPRGPGHRRSSPHSTSAPHRQMEGYQATVLSCNAATGPAAGGGPWTPPSHSEGAALLELVIECACREWPLLESAQIVEWPRHLRWCFRQCRSPKSCVMVSRCATHSRPLGWRAHAYLWVPAGLAPYAAHHQQAGMSSASLSSCGGRCALPAAHEGHATFEANSHLNPGRQQKLGLEGT